MPSSCHECFLQSVVIFQETVFVRLECRQRKWIEDIHLKSGINYFKAKYWSLQEVHSLKLQSWWNYTHFKGLKNLLNELWNCILLFVGPSVIYLCCPHSSVPNYWLRKKKSKIMSQMLSESDFPNTGRCQTGFVSHPTSHICLPETHSSRSNEHVKTREEQEGSQQLLCQSQFLQDSIIAGSRRVFTSLETVGAWYSSYFHERANWSCSTLLMGHLPSPSVKYNHIKNLHSSKTSHFPQQLFLEVLLGVY